MGNPNRRPMTAAEYQLAQAKAMTERQLLDAILGTPRNPGIALALGWRGYHTHRSEHSPAGFPDLVLVRRGRLVFAELKRQANRHQPTPEQDAWLEDLGLVADGITCGCRALAAQVNDPEGCYCECAEAVVEVACDHDAPRVRVYLWRPLDLLDGTIAAVLK